VGFGFFKVSSNQETIIIGSDNNNVINRKDYILLKYFRKEIEVENEKDFSISFWVYHINSSTAAFPTTIIKKVWKTLPFFSLHCLFIFLHLGIQLNLQVYYNF